MSININTKELKTILESTPPGHNIMLSGRHGRAMVTGYGTETWIDS